jgi:hypothetical protein
MIPMLIALFFGAGAFSSEIDRSAQFLFSQPVSWKKLVAAKTIVGFAVLAASAVLTAVIYRLVCPEQYVRFATLERLGIGVYWAVIVIGIPYLAGLIFSTVLPGAAGGMLVSAVATGLMILNTTLTQRYVHPDHGFWVIVFSTLGWPIGAVAAMLVTARFGLTLHTGDRIRRYSTVLIGVVGISLMLSLVLCLPRLNPQRFLPRSWFTGSASYASIGPDGSHAVIRQGFRHYLFVGPGYKQAPFWLTYDEQLICFYWPTPNTVIAAGGRNVLLDRHGAWSPAGAGESASLAAVSMDGRGHLTAREIKVPAQIADPRTLIPSPSGRRFLVVPVELVSAWDAPQGIVTSRTDRSVPGSTGCTVAIEDTGLIGILDCSGPPALTVLTISPSVIWWQSDNEIGYLDNAGERHYLPVR